MLEQGLTSLITSDAGIVALIGASGLYPVILPEGATLPALTYQIVSSFSEYALDGSTETTKRIQFDAWGLTYGAAKEVLAALHNLLDGCSGLLTDGTQLLGAFRSIETDYYDSGLRAFRALTEYSFRYAE